MALVSRGLIKLRESCVKMPSVYIQLRWKKEPRRKPKWLPMAPSKVFRIPQYPYVPPDEQELINELLDEYYRKVESMRQLFKEELGQRAKDDGNTQETRKQEEANFCLLLEENKKENERVKTIREETLEILFQEQQMQYLQLEEERKIEEQNKKMRIEEIVRKEKERHIPYITQENLEEIIEQALNNPKSLDFAIDVNGNIKWEGNPPPEFEEELKRKIKLSMES